MYKRQKEEPPQTKRPWLLDKKDGYIYIFIRQKGSRNKWQKHQTHNNNNKHKKTLSPTERASAAWVAYAIRPWDYRGKCYMDRKRIQCLSKHRSMYTSIFDPLRAIARYWSEIATFSYPLAFNAQVRSGHGTIAVNVTQLERGFNACKTSRRKYPSIFNRFPVIQAWSLKVRHFSTFFAHFGLPCVRPWDNHGKCYMDRKRIQCLSNASQHVPLYL